MSEEKFFNSVKKSLQGYAPEVPASVYSSMRRKLWMSRFMRFDASRLNVWYLLIGLSVSTAALVYANNSSSVTANAVRPLNTPSLLVAPNAAPTACTATSVSCANANECNQAVAIRSAHSKVDDKSLDPNEVVLIVDRDKEMIESSGPDQIQGVLSPETIENVTSAEKTETIKDRKGRVLHVPVYEPKK